MGTGLEKSTCCQPEAVSPVKVAVANLVPALVQRLATWVPVLAVALTVLVFWLLLQFNRAMRVMKNAGNAPVGHIDSAVMVNAQLREGMQMLQVVTLTRSLGRRVGDSPEVWAWADAGACEVQVRFEHGRCKRWVLTRPGDAAE